jgi:hypothetical protein
MVTRWEIMPITEGDRELAKDLGQKCHEATGMRASTRIFTKEAGMQDVIGQLGQLKFHHWLDQRSIKHEYHTFNTDGMGDAFDFEVEGKLIDIDTAHNKYTRNGLAIPDEQLHFLYYWEKPIDKFDFVFGVMLNDKLTIAKIMGFLSREEVKQLPIGVFGSQKARYCKPLDLHPMGEYPW